MVGKENANFLYLGKNIILTHYYLSVAAVGACLVWLNAKPQPPVCDINLITAGSARLKSKSWPLGLICMLSIIACLSGSSSFG